MATVTRAGVRLTSERRFFLGMAAALAICTFAGFARSYYLMAYTGAASLPPLVHLHGALFTSWVLLFGFQAGLISAGRTDIHMRTGVIGVVLAAVMVVLGIIVAITRSQPPPAAAFTREQFLIFPFIAIGLFALFVGCGFANRHRPDHHKRYMLLATINVVFPAFARMTALIPILPRGVFGATVIADLFLAALVILRSEVPRPDSSGNAVGRRSDAHLRATQIHHRAELLVGGLRAFADQLSQLGCQLQFGGRFSKKAPH